MAKPLRRLRRKRRSGSAAAKTISLALGKFDRERLLEDLLAKHRLVLELEDMLEQRYPWSFATKQFDGCQYNPNSIRDQLLPRLRKCATTFSDGHPNYVCRLPYACPFCARSQSDSVRRLYRGMGFARLERNAWINVLFGAVLHQPCTVAGILPAFKQLRRYASTVREAIRLRAKSDERAGIDVKQYAVYQLDFFIHLSRVRTGRKFAYRPHLHYVAQMADPRTQPTIVAKYLEAKIRESYAFDNLRLARYENFRIDLTRSTKKSHSVERLACIGGYCGTLVKPDASPEIRTAAITNLPPRFRQRTSKNAKADEERLRKAFANAQPRGEHNARFDFESATWKPC